LKVYEIPVDIIPCPPVVVKLHNMLSNTAAHHQNLANAYSLALSDSQARSRILHNSRLFSKSKEKHSVELTRLDPNQSTDPETYTFTEASQLLEHFRQSDSNAVHHNAAVEI
jgi:hypothetical protein